MKYIHIILLLLLTIAPLLSGCKNDNPVSSIDSDCGIVTFEHKYVFYLTGSGYSNTPIPDTVVAGLYPTPIIIELKYDGRIYTYSYTEENLLLQNDTVKVYLRLTTPSNATGSYPWSDLNVDSNASGCLLRLSNMSGKKTVTYRSISGNTSIKLFQQNPPLWDSLFTSYCGNLKDSLGNVVTLTKGKFYMAMR